MIDPVTRLTEGCVPTLRIVQGRDGYGSWCREALTKEEGFVEGFIAYWKDRNPRLVRRAETQLGWLQAAKRRYQ